MKQIVIIGANEFQLPLIKKAKEKKYITHVFAWEDGAVGKQYADYFYPISITEKELIYEECLRIKPDAVCTIASDLAAVTVGYLCDRLHLPGNPMDCIALTTNKYLMRKALQKHHIAVPYFTCVKSAEELRDCTLPFPLIIKPTDRSGSRGIYKVEQKEELKQAIQDAAAYSFEGKVMAEEYVDGQEYSCEGISFQGHHSLLAFTKKYTTGSPNFIETGHMEPADLNKKQQQKVEELIKKALDALNIKNGATHTEFKINSRQECVIIEIGARMGGDFIGSYLVEKTTGCDYVDMALQVACGCPPAAIPKQTGYAAVRFILNQEDEQRYQDIKKQYPQQVSDKQLEGSLEDSVTDSSSRHGHYFIQTNSRQKLEEILRLW